MASSAVSTEFHPKDIPPAETFREKVSTLGAFFGLALIDLFVGIAGFSRFYRLISAFPTRRRGVEDLDEARLVCVTVNRAATYYFKRAWCLQRSATAVCLLRCRGFAAELVIGAPEDALQRSCVGRSEWTDCQRLSDGAEALRRSHALLKSNSD